MDSTERRRRLERLTAAPGLCETCRHLELLETARSVFVRCAKAAEDRRLARYPPLPVIACPAYECATGVGSSR